jgi:hypothetical protein
MFVAGKWRNFPLRFTSPKLTSYIRSAPSSTLEPEDLLKTYKEPHTFDWLSIIPASAELVSPERLPPGPVLVCPDVEPPSRFPARSPPRRTVLKLGEPERLGAPSHLLGKSHQTTTSMITT